MEDSNPRSDLFEVLRNKALLKQEVYQKTLTTFRQFKSVIIEMVRDYQERFNGNEQLIPFDFRDRGEFEFELKFGGDVLLFMMHTNIFEFSRTHEVMKTNYIHDDKTRSYCGVINVFNFLADSFKYNRINDIGYMIGRIFVNRDLHYFIEGKRELGMLYNNFSTSLVNRDSVAQIIESAILYTINFDLLTPPYDEVKMVTVSDIQASLDNMTLKTGKRLGFRFQADPAE
ncbi:MAG: hypothetical protein K0B15_06780 [Lentimicrobium sp.]|nr:hypothetical protein [Lentimicrobium sp.]